MSKLSGGSASILRYIGRHNRNISSCFHYFVQAEFFAEVIRENVS